MPERRRVKKVKTVKERNKEKGYDKVFDVARVVAGPGAGTATVKALTYAQKIAKLAAGEGVNKVFNKRPNSDKNPSDRRPMSHSPFDLDVAAYIPKVNEMPRRRPFRTVDAPVRPQKPPPPQPPPQREDQAAAAVIHHK